MDFEPMRLFLSAENIALHKEYLKTLRLRYSVLTKSAPVLSGLDLTDIYRRLTRSPLKDDALERLSEIRAHEIFFDSFSKKRVSCKSLRRQFGSEESFLYELIKAAKSARSGFLFVYSGSTVRYELVGDGEYRFTKAFPVLAVDICEHAYFRDYGFDRVRYIESAISCLDLGKIS